MEKQKYQISPNLQVIPNPKMETAMIYHSLYGNPRIVSDESLRFLYLFKKPITIEKISRICDEDPEKIVQKFAEIFFLVNPSFDERTLLLKKKKQQLSLIQKQQTVDRMGLAISDLCNFGCTHCIHLQPKTSLPTYRQINPQSNMTWRIAKQCVDKYVTLMNKQGKTHGKIHFGNAEPLINWSVIKQVLEYCSQIDNLSFEFAINTNLTLMTKRIAMILKKYRVRIATSLDGTKIANNAIRITKEGQGTFTRILKKFDLLDQIDYPLDGFSITVTKDNFEFINTDILDLAIERRMNSIAFDYDLIGLTHIPVEQRVSKLMQLKKYANSHSIDFFGTWDSPFRNLTSESFSLGEYAFCAAVQGKSLEFNTDGSIKICSHTTTAIGHVNRFDDMFKKNSSLTQIVDSRFPGTDEYCSGCEIEGFCGGQCHVTREAVVHFETGDQQTFFSDMCNFYRKITKALIEECLQSSSDG